MFGDLGLNQHAAGGVGASRPPRHLHEFGKQPLGGAEIRAVQAAVGVEHNHKVEPREIVAFGEHLRAHQNIDAALADTAVEFRPVVFVRSAVPIDAHHGGLRQKGAQGFFHALCAVADGGQVLIAAFGAFERNGGAVVAVVAAHLAGALVQHHFGRAVGAAESVAAVAAKQRGGETAPVEVNQRHAARLEILFQQIQSLRRKAVVEFQTAYV